MKFTIRYRDESTPRGEAQITLDINNSGHEKELKELGSIGVGTTQTLNGFFDIPYLKCQVLNASEERTPGLVTVRTELVVSLLAMKLNMLAGDNSESITSIQEGDSLRPYLKLFEKRGWTPS